MLEKAVVTEITEQHFYSLLREDPSDRPVLDAGSVSVHRSCRGDTLLIETPMGVYVSVTL